MVVVLILLQVPALLVFAVGTDGCTKPVYEHADRVRLFFTLLSIVAATGIAHLATLLALSWSGWIDWRRTLRGLFWPWLLMIAWKVCAIGFVLVSAMRCGDGPVNAWLSVDLIAGLCVFLWGVCLAIIVVWPRTGA